MAHQFHIAHNGHLEGAGVIAGGPYECTVDGDKLTDGGSVWRGMFECTAFMRVSCAGTNAACQFFTNLTPLSAIIPEKYHNAPDFFAGPGNKNQNAEETLQATQAMAANSAARAKLRADAGQIDPLGADAGLYRSKVYIIHGRQDTLLPRGVADATFLTYRDLYQQNAGADWQKTFADNVIYETRVPATHAILTNSYLKDAAPVIQACTTFNLGGSFINDCSTGACTETACNGACAAEPPCDDASGLCSACTLPSCVGACEAAVTDGAASNAGSVFSAMFGASLRKPCDPADPTTTCAADAGEGQPRVTTSKAWRDWNLARLYEFSQRRYVGADLSNEQFLDMSVDNRAYLFVPKACDPKNRKAGDPLCRLHVAFHGCLQGPPTIGDNFNGKPPFVLFAGYTEWADANNVIVLFPQATRKSFPLLKGDFQHSNPQGCWNLWDYVPADEGKFATRGGLQIAMVARMVNALVGDPAFLKTSN